MFGFFSNLRLPTMPTRYGRRLTGRGAQACMAAIALMHALHARAQVITYEGTGFPETKEWLRSLAGTPGPDRAIEDGWLIQVADLPAGWTGPGGDAEFFRMSLSNFVGTPKFFIEWRVVTDVPAKVLELSATPVALVGGGQGAGFYHTTITNTEVQFFRDTMFPLVFVDIEPGLPHIYRLELDTDLSFVWYIDGQLGHSGIPDGTYPDPSSSLVWGVRRSYYDSVTAWDFVRAGRIPDDASGDYDSDAAVTLIDHYFVVDCLTKDGPGIFGGPGEDAGPGCRFADFDTDHDVDLADFAEFQNLFRAE